ncbi:hypothetical protein GDO86_019998 [Hymenochirus boettgeri]|uniref:Peptidase S1 domain-containing protein n=1 Tax=Hymenochirus boettgeri TaxID=247094 RepID=A0A8T2IJT0_9PIPI|nr:hypothetical protein GDO86_019998 [Hymenochirus boettgeri]
MYLGQGECGIPLVPSRIVGGQNANYGKWPWQASIRLENQHFCGGSLISDTFIITAAHCFLNDPSIIVANVRVYLGSYTLSESTAQEVSFKVKNIFNYSTYKKVGDSGDISLVELDGKVTFTDYIIPICLPASTVTFPTGLQSWLTGWGYLQSGVNEQASNVLQEVSLPLINATKCDELYHTSSQGAATANILSDMICAGYIDGGKTACQGDSGGPLVSNDGNRWFLVGVVSFGVGCGLPYRPGVNTLVANYTDWIIKNDPNAIAWADIKNLKNINRRKVKSHYRGY